MASNQGNQGSQNKGSQNQGGFKKDDPRTKEAARKGGENSHGGQNQGRNKQ